MKTIFLAAILNVCSASDDWTIMGSNMKGLDDYSYDRDSISLSLDGKRVAISSRETNTAKGKTFNVRMFGYDGNDWKQYGGTIEGDIQTYNSHISMSSDGTRVAIGAYGHWNNIDCYVRVYEYNGRIWKLMGGDVQKQYQHFGCGKYVSLSSDGTKVAFADTRSTTDNGVYSGHVSVFKYDAINKNWQQMGQNINGEYTMEECCTLSLSPDGTMVALGSPSNNGSSRIEAGKALGSPSNNGSSRIEAGKARMFQFVEGNIWSQMGVDIEGKAAGEKLGTSVSLSLDGTIVAIGIPHHDVIYNGGANHGAVRVLKYNGSDWEQRGQDITQNGHWFNFGDKVSLSLDGTRVVVSADLADGINGQDSGQVRLFDYDENEDVWKEVRSEAAKDEFGESLSLSSDVTQEEGDGEGTSEMEVNLSPGEEPTAESSSIHTHFTFMSSTVLLAFWMAVYGNWN